MSQPASAVPPAPDAPGANVSDADLDACLRVLRALATEEGGVSDYFRTPRYKPLRQAMQLYLDDLRGQLFHGQPADKIRKGKEKKREKVAREQQERAMDRVQADKTRMRAERIRMLGELEQDAAATEGEHLSIGFVPDGAVDSGPGGGDLLLRGPPPDDEGEATAAVAAVEEAPESTDLHTLRACYTCKARFRKLHHFYAQMCPTCAGLNWEKRMQVASLEGRVVLLTGARVKIGFQVALKLLRCGATVLATSRFAVDCAARFAEQPDAAAWSGRLQVFGLDMRDLASLERLCAYLVARGGRLDAIINNACQTIRRPAAYYAHLMPAELADERPAALKQLLEHNDACFVPPPSPPSQRAIDTERPKAAASVPPERADGQAAATLAGGSAAGGGGDDALVESAAERRQPMAAVPSALWSQAPLWAAAEGVRQPDTGEARNFPVGVRDVNGQQLDTRATNSWLLKVHEVSTSEAAEARSSPPRPSRPSPHPHTPTPPANPHSAASTARAPRHAPHRALVVPRRLAAGARHQRPRAVHHQLAAESAPRGDLDSPPPHAPAPPLTCLTRPRAAQASPASPRFVINVSAMEGKFYRYKTPNHPHTNMAKAALNMMTRTCAHELFATSAILMNSVDTGWINDENPLEKAAANAERHNFQTPLDEVDAAARIVDPLLSVVNGGEQVHGKFLKDYRAIEW